MHDFDELARRVERLETESDYSRRDAVDAGQAVYDLGLRVERLESAVATLAARLKELGGDGPGAAPADDRPPHW